MPYTNVPENLWGKMDRCVDKVMASGKDKKAAIAICHESVTKGKEVNEPITDLQLPEGVAIADMLQEVENSLNSDLSPDELRQIDQLYADVQAGKVTLDETEKAMVSVRPSGGTPTITTPDGGTTGGGTSGGSSDKKRVRCYEHMRKLGVEDKTARQICSRTFGAPTAKEVVWPATFAVNKQADNRYRWIMVTSSSFVDREGEIVSQKALEADTERMSAEKDYGWLDWWHTPIRLGSCDFSAMHGRLSIESGLYDDSFVGAKFAEAQQEFAASRSFYHPLTEPDSEGVYHHIRTFRRAVLPREYAANVLTTHAVVKEDTTTMLADKVKELIARLGGDTTAETKVASLLAQADATEKAALAVGLATKETEPPPPAPEPEKPPVEAPAQPIAEQAGMFVADMKPEEFDAAVKEALKAALSPFVEVVAQYEQQMKAALAPISAEIDKLQKENREAVAVAVKEAGAGIAVQIQQIANTQAELQARLAALEGLTPRGYRASQDPNTATKERAAPGPGPDEKANFFSQFVAGIVTGKPTQGPPA